jgi:hypothetical protein
VDEKKVHNEKLRLKAPLEAVVCGPLFEAVYAIKQAVSLPLASTANLTQL